MPSRSCSFVSFVVQFLNPARQRAPKLTAKRAKFAKGQSPGGRTVSASLFLADLAILAVKSARGVASGSTINNMFQRTQAIG
jgi:hypothetical protein